MSKIKLMVYDVHVMLVFQPTDICTLFKWPAIAFKYYFNIYIDNNNKNQILTLLVSKFIRRYVCLIDFIKEKKYFLYKEPQPRPQTPSNQKSNLG